MRRTFYIFVLLFAGSTQLISQGIGIGTPTPHSSAALEISSDEKGVLITRMSSSQRTSISSPAIGLMVFDINTKTFWFYDGVWIEITPVNLGNHTASQNLDLDGKRIKNLNTPIVNGDGANKLYVDNHSDADDNPTNEIQTLSLANDTIFLSNGGGKIPTTGVFENASGLVKNTGSNQDDFVFGNATLPANGQNVSERMFFFDEDKGAFRAGRLNNSSTWATDSLGDHSIALGYNVVAKGVNTIALGNQNRAVGNQSLAMGSQTLANGMYATSMGNGTEANGLNATALGSFTEANGGYSTAMGYLARSNGDYSFSLGLGTRSESYNSIVFGRYNVGVGNSTIWVPTDPLLEVGIGASTLMRENALTILKNGTISFKDYSFPNSDGTNNQYMSTDGNGSISWTTVTDKSATNELINAALLSGNNFSFTEAGNIFNVDFTSLSPSSISDDDQDTNIEFNNGLDRIVFNADGLTVAKMETDSVFIDGDLKIGSTPQSRLYLGDTFMHGGTATKFVIQNNVNNTVDFSIDNQGEVGIGTNSPIEVLDIIAPDDYDGIRISGGSDNHRLQIKLDNNAIEGREYVFRSTGENANQGGGKLLIRDNAANSTRMTIDSSGYVGIGIVSPGQRLHVNGFIRSDSLAGSGKTPVFVNAGGKLIRADSDITHEAYIDYVDFVPVSQDNLQIHPFDGVIVADGDGDMLGSISKIPDGATITEATFIYHDDDSSEFISLGIQYNDGAGGGVSTYSIGNSVTSGNTRAITTFTGLDFTLDRTQYHYALKASSSGWGANIKLFNVILKYSLP